MFADTLPIAFLSHASSLLADTNRGLSMGKITQLLSGFAVQFGRNIPYVAPRPDAPNKRTVLYENLQSFTASEQHYIIGELCNNSSLVPMADECHSIKVQLGTTFAQFAMAVPNTQLEDALIEEARHWLSSIPTAYQEYERAVGLYKAGILHRNVLDNMRLALELAVKDILGNGKSLEHQKAELGTFLKQFGLSVEFRNMFITLVDYYSKYQNSYVKHDSAVNRDELEFIMELTASFIKHVVRLRRSVPQP